MTPKEKAIELFNKYYYLFPEKFIIDFGYKESKQCALIAVDEILSWCGTADIRYWQEVKQEIENL